MTDCHIREHVGLEKVVAKIGMNEPLLPDPELGQDVAFLAFVIKKQQGEIERLTGALKEIRVRTDSDNIQMIIDAVLPSVKKD